MGGDGAREDRDAFEGGLGTALKRTGDGFTVEVRLLIDGGVTRGRRRLVLRRSAMVTGSVAALAVIGLGGSYVTHGIGGTGGSRDTGDGAAVGTAKGTPDSGYSAQQVIKTLEGLMPEGEFSKESGRGTVPAADDKRALPPFASFVYDDGDGKAAVSVGLSRQDTARPPGDDGLSCPDKNLIPFESCSSTTLEDGSRLTLFRGWEYPDRREETKHWYANLLTPEGYRISLSQWNAPAEKGAHVSRSAPPLSLDRMKKLVLAEEWRPIFASMPGPVEQPPRQAPEQPPAASGDGILDKLTGQLPKRLTVKASGKQETEYAYVVVDDGRGKSFVQINVQSDMSDVEGDLFGADAKVLADGTKVTAHQGPGEKGADGVEMWTVDTMRPDGFRVVVSAFNTANQNEAATREEPALTLAEMEKIATSRVWLG
ncbi:hypothetical protein [Streptomyces sp. NPDC053728]|uniref:hypothetical protein n=1 Tax=Streptomyces sp. NPDC053728 TaxID=3155534 RepID=UPI0034253547